ncbi:hypothetical protein KY290_027535 [Solanum tuberosum]|uniref:UBN2 domain-containing protein n=1 Tax=Solanum tuberosum TaxID=4113 RepID=A0ABQ7UGL5_SOLTU|nr:hypothetical protein KY290_027535 [Solanum tuberosum]
MYTRFTTITNEIYSLGEIIPNRTAVRKLLSVLPELWESKAEGITKAWDLDVLAMDELIGNLMTYELKKNQEKEIGVRRKEKNLVLKATTPEDFEDENIALMTKRFSRMIKRGQVLQMRCPKKIDENTGKRTLEHRRSTSEKANDIKNYKYIPTNRWMTN